MFFLRRLDWTDVHDFLLCCVGQALICQCKEPDDYQCYSEDCSSAIVPPEFESENTLQNTVTD